MIFKIKLFIITDCCYYDWTISHSLNNENIAKSWSQTHLSTRRFEIHQTWKSIKIKTSFVFNFLIWFIHQIFVLINFIHSMQVYWPNIKDELILMHYLFSPKYRVKNSEAILIIILLLDLQEDFRFFIKQSIMRFLLR